LQDATLITPSKQTAILISLSAFVVLAILFSVIGLNIGFNSYQDSLENNDNWKSLGSPPAKTEHLLAARTATIYVQTNDGRIFSCYRESQYDQSCWNEVDLVPHDDELGDCSNPVTGIPPEPSGVVDRLIRHHCMDSPVYSGDHVFAYILLSDGTVMQWISQPIGPPPNEFRQLVQKTTGGSLIGLISSIIVSMLLLIALLRHSKTNHP
jgi:hypothetical protein